MPTLPDNPAMHDFQAYARQMEEERGFTDGTPLEQCLLLGEEVGELFKAVRKCSGIKTDEQRDCGSVDLELADILIYTCCLANRFNIDLEQAFRKKEEINKQRTWS
jgi:NTP pyrophosphatase (non-canonical NTP hydrolase)